MKQKSKVAAFFALWLGIMLSTGCALNSGFDGNLRAITVPYRFNITRWEASTLGGIAGRAFARPAAPGGVAEVTEYFNNVARLQTLAEEIAAAKSGGPGDAASLEAASDQLERRNEALAGTVERVIATQIAEALNGQGIYNPLVGLKADFPTVAFVLSQPPHLLVVSPRDRIESLRKISLVPDMSTAEMEDIEAQVDKLGVSSLVVDLGGFSTYPSLVIDSDGLRFAIDAAAEEWVHQYLFFKPLGFRYMLDTSGLRPDYDVATMDETAAGIVSKEIGTLVCRKYYPWLLTDNTTSGTSSGFDFNQAMRSIRQTVDGYLARGEINQAEAFMEQQRQEMARHGYDIRKLNQAYFAFHGAYADEPGSISPIGTEMAQLRQRSASLKAFLDSVAVMTNPQELAANLK